MSFTADVKAELCARRGKGRHCEIAELAAILNGCCKISRENGEPAIELHSDNPAVAKRFLDITGGVFSAQAGVTESARRHRILISGGPCEKILSAAGLLAAEGGLETPQCRISPMVVRQPCCKRAYIRGAFIACGSVAEPEKPYHLEFICETRPLAEGLRDMIAFFEIHPKIITRSGRCVVYLKEGEGIADLLNIMEAHASLLQFESKRVYKSVRNKINRESNCEVANMNKTVCASVRQIRDIRYIISKKGLDYLPEQLAEVAEIRLNNPGATLLEISAMLGHPVGKSGVNHRFRKISEIADIIMAGAE